MSKYTTEVRYICEYFSGKTLYEYTIDDVIKGAVSSIFNFDFPIFNETYRNGLECKILKNFFTREICEETVGLWQLRLCQRLNQIMPYYNQLYKSLELEILPFDDIDYTEKIYTQNNSETQSNSAGQNITDFSNLGGDDVTAFSGNDKLKSVSDFSNLGGDDTTTFSGSDVSKKTTDFSNLGGDDVVKHTGSDTVKNTISYEGKELNKIIYGSQEETSVKTPSGQQLETSVTSGSLEKSPGTKIKTSSDTPQSSLDDFLANKYLTNAQKEYSTSNDKEIYNDVTTNKTTSFNNYSETTNTNVASHTDNSESGFENRVDTSNQVSTYGGIDTTTKNSKTNTIENDTITYGKAETVTKNSKTNTTTDNDTTYGKIETITKNSKNNTTTNTTDETNTTAGSIIDTLITKKGKLSTKSYSELLNEYRATFINIDLLIMQELEDLFMLVW